MPGLVLLVVGVVAVSAAAPLMAAMTVPALAIVFWRNAVGALVTVPTALRARDAVDRRAWVRMTWAGLALAVHFATFVPALRLTSVASATALVSMHIAFVVAWDLLGGARLGRRTSLGLLVAVGGVLVVTGVDVTVSTQALAGDLLALLGGAAFAAYVVLGGQVRQEVGTATYSVVCYTVCALAVLPLCLVADQPLWGYDARQWLLLGALTVTAQLLGHSVFNHLLLTMAPMKVSLALLLEVPGAALLAALVLGQRPPTATYAGLVLILGGIALVLRAAPRVPDPTPVS